MVNVDSKEVLARLLAEEELHVVFRNVRTASFQPNSRLLTLPVLQTSNLIVNWHVGHEVGHALFTPVKEYEALAKRFGSLPNLFEDFRINDKICERYPGLAHVRNAAYVEMFDTNFYGNAYQPVDHSNVNELHFLDRLNIHFKVGTYAGVEFSTEEQEIVKLCENIKTFSDVENLCVLVNEFLQNQEEEKSESESSSEDDEEGSETDSESSSEDGEEGSESESKSGSEEDEGGSELGLEDDEESDSDSDSDSEDGEKKGSDFSLESTEGSEIESRDDEKNTEVKNSPSKNKENDVVPEQQWSSSTIDNEEDSFVQASAETDFRTNYRTLPTFQYNWKDFIMSHSEFAQYIRNWLPLFGTSKTDLDDFLKSNQKTIEDAAQTFLMNRQIDHSEPSMVHYSGVLDPNRLHCFAYDDNIFLTETVVRSNLTSHGLLMFIDFSQSMEGKLYSTVQQLLNLVYFANEAMIPFRVYGFTYLQGTGGSTKTANISDNPEIVDFVERSTKTMFELFTSDMELPAINKMADILLKYSKYIRPNARRKGRNRAAPRIKSFMWSTPLDLTLHLSKHIGREMKEDLGLEKMNIIFLTDGLSDSISNISEPFQHVSTPEYRSVFYITDEILKTTKKIHASEFTQMMSDNLAEYLNANIVNFYLASKTRFNRNLSWMNTKGEELVEKAVYFVPDTHGFRKNYFVNDDRFSIENVEISTDSRRSAMSSFAKRGRVAKTTRILMNNFAEMIA